MIVDKTVPQDHHDQSNQPTRAAPLNEPALGPSRRRGTKKGRAGAGAGLADEEAVDEEDDDVDIPPGMALLVAPRRYLVSMLDQRRVKLVTLRAKLPLQHDMHVTTLEGW